MDLISENTATTVELSLDITTEEQEHLLRYAKYNLSIKELNDMKMEWAITDLIKNALEECTV